MYLSRKLRISIWTVLAVGGAISTSSANAQEDLRFAEKPLFAGDESNDDSDTQENSNGGKITQTTGTGTSGIWDFMNMESPPPSTLPTVEQETTAPPTTIGQEFPKEPLEVAPTDSSSIVESPAAPVANPSVNTDQETTPSEESTSTKEEPAAVEPVAVEPLAVEPVAVEPVAVEPLAVEPLAVEPVVAAPTTSATAAEKAPASVSKPESSPVNEPLAKEGKDTKSEAGPDGDSPSDSVDSVKNSVVEPEGKVEGNRPGLAAKPLKPTTILDLQPYLEDSAREITSEGKTGTIHLINLNKYIGAWYLIRVSWSHMNNDQVYHLEVKFPGQTRLSLSEGKEPKLIIEAPDGNTSCDFWTDNSAVKAKLKNTIQPYIELCDDRIYLRNQVEGHRSTKEWFVDILRDKVWGGEQITTFVKRNFFKDKFLLSSNDEQDLRDVGADGSMDPNTGPLIAKVADEHLSTLLEPKSLGLKFLGGKNGKLYAGRWYKTLAHSDVYVSVLEPKLIAPDILESHKNRAKDLDAIEKTALAYFIAFDLTAYQLHFRLGTDHPRVDWSNRTLDKVIDPSRLGPDGIDSKYPLASTGMIPPHQFKNTVAAFTGGFKRTHGAFKWGKLSLINDGSHYGFMENGAMFSRLNPGLSTIVIYRDGEVNMKTWTESDSTNLESVLHARQNGVAIVEYEQESGGIVPGKLVNRWGQGNWSGSQSSNLRTLRAGVCLQQRNNRKYLIYGYFSSVTPSAMARAFQAYNCQYAMHLDMNALEHTYLSVLSQKGDKIQIENLIEGMNVLDKSYEEQIIPRFLGFADNRDFFYLIKKDQ